MWRVSQVCEGMARCKKEGNADDGLPVWLSGKESTCSAGEADSIPGLGKSLGEENGNPLQYSCWENAMDRGVWRATAHGVAESQTCLSD